MQITRPRVRKEEERILPLVNVVFLLLIFFMIAGELASRDNLEISPPVSSSEAPAGAREVVVQITTSGNIVVDGKAVEEAGLAGALRERLGDGPPPKVFLNADAGLPAVRIVAILERVHEAGAGEVRLLTLTEKTP